MTSFRLRRRDALVLATLISCSTVTVAWVSRPLVTCSRPTTQLSMFDWFNPKPKTPASSEEKKSDDFLSNMFNQGTAPKTEEKKEEAPEKSETVEEVKAEAVVVGEVKSEPTAVAEVAKEAEPAVKEQKKEPVSEAPAEKPEHDIHTGVVSWFNRQYGYGFIKPTDGSTTGDIFVHQSEIQVEGYRYLMDGERVEFRLEYDDKKRAKAIHVTGPDGGDVKIGVRRKERAAKGEESN